MDKIAKCALMNTPFQLAHLIAAIDLLPKEQQNRFVAVVLGIVDPDKEAAELSENVNIAYYGDCHREEYNYLTGKVKFSYDNSSTRYFKTQEEAEAYTNEGKFDFSNSTYAETEEYKFKGARLYKSEGEVEVDFWKDNSKIK